jgi:hypothetical protein
MALLYRRASSAATKRRRKHSIRQIFSALAVSTVVGLVPGGITTIALMEMSRDTYPGNKVQQNKDLLEIALPFGVLVAGAVGVLVYKPERKRQRSLGRYER